MLDHEDCIENEKAQLIIKDKVVVNKNSKSKEVFVIVYVLLMQLNTLLYEYYRKTDIVFSKLYYLFLILFSITDLVLYVIVIYSIKNKENSSYINNNKLLFNFILANIFFFIVIERLVTSLILNIVILIILFLLNIYNYQLNYIETTSDRLIRILITPTFLALNFILLFSKLFSLIDNSESNRLICLISMSIIIINSLNNKYNLSFGVMILIYSIRFVMKDPIQTHVYFLIALFVFIIIKLKYLLF